MAWFGDGLSSLSNLKGQITSFTKEVLSEGIVEEIADERTKELNEANEKCVQLEELLVTKDAEISLLRRQNSELQKVVHELDRAENTQTASGENQIEDEGSAFFWDPPSAKIREAKRDNQTRLLEEQLSQATVKIRELEAKLKNLEKTSREDVLDGNHRTELSRAKQDMINRIIQMGEKNREAERNMKRLQLDEAVLVSDFRGIISQLGSTEQLDLLRAALKSLEGENERDKRYEKSDETNEKSVVVVGRIDDGQFESVSLKTENDTKLKGDFCEKKELELRDRIAQLEEENAGLNGSVVELDQQHSESIEKLLSIKEEMQKKHETLQRAYEQLYAEHNELETKLEAARAKLESAEANNNTIESVSGSSGREEAVKEMAKRVREILKSEDIATEEDEAIFESLAERYVETKWKKEMLERRTTELSRELKDLSELKESLQIEGDDMQLNIESLLGEIQHLKSSLPSIPEASEERVASLETETESLQEEIERLNSECAAARQQNSELVMAVQSIEGTLRNQENLEAELRNTKQQLDIAQRQLAGASKNVENNENMLEDLSRRLHASLDENNELRKRQASLEASIDEDRRGFVEKEKRLLDEIETLRREKENLETQPSASSQIDDLEYDLMNMRKELDEALSQAEKANQENERLAKEKSSLVEQLSATQDESLDNIELLNTEMVLLEQKYAALEKDAGDMEERFRLSEENAVKIKEELSTCKISNEELLREMKTGGERRAELENEVSRLAEELERFGLVESDLKRCEEELRVLRLTESDRAKVESRCAELEAELNALKINEEQRCVDIEEKIGELRVEEDNKMKVGNEEETKQLREALDEKIRENEILKEEISRLSRMEQSLLESGKESVSMARETISGLSELVREKDSELESVKSERDELVDVVKKKHNESVQYHQEIQRLTGLLNEQISRGERLREIEAELLWAQNELQVSRQRLKGFEESADGAERCGVVEHSVRIAEAAMLAEKCAALEAALIQEQAGGRIMQNRLAESETREVAAGKELERLRTHLMEMEASYTEEALIAEHRQKELESKLAQAEERVKNSSTVYTSASIRANQQVETLQQQMNLIVQQRDDIQRKLSQAEDKVLAHAASLTNLQIVLEQFQRDRDKDIIAATEKIRQQLDDSHRKQAELNNEISNLKDQLNEAKECLQAASRLSEELDKKTERIDELKQEVSRLTELVNTADDRIQGANRSGEGKVDRALVKNLVIGYVSSSPADRLSVLRVLATVLDFNETERDKTGLNSPAASGSWFAGLLGTVSGAPSKDQEASLSAAFVRFLESESKPKAQLPALPISTTPPPRPGHSRQHSTSSNHSTLLLSNIALPTFPDFVPSRNTGSILKEVLKDS